MSFTNESEQNIHFYQKNRNTQREYIKQCNNMKFICMSKKYLLATSPGWFFYSNYEYSPLLYRQYVLNSHRTYSLR